MLNIHAGRSLLSPGRVVVARISPNVGDRDHPARTVRGEGAQWGGVQPTGQISADHPTPASAGGDRVNQRVA